jgi:hypothetical protein
MMSEMCIVQGLEPGGVYGHLSHLGGNPTPDHVFEDQVGTRRIRYKRLIKKTTLFSIVGCCVVDPCWFQ